MSLAAPKSLPPAGQGSPWYNLLAASLPTVICCAQQPSCFHKLLRSFIHSVVPTMRSKVRLGVTVITTGAIGQDQLSGSSVRGFKI